MTPKKALLFIAAVWLSSSLISFPAIVWWRATQKVSQSSLFLLSRELLFIIIIITIAFYYCLRSSLVPRKMCVFYSRRMSFCLCVCLRCRHSLYSLLCSLLMCVCLCEWDACFACLYFLLFPTKAEYFSLQAKDNVRVMFFFLFPSISLTK